MAGGHPTECRGECSWIFSDLEEKGVKELRAMARPVSYDKGELIFQEGEPAFGFYVICTGKVKLAKHSPQGKKQILKLLGPGEMLGEKTMFDREVYTAYAQTLDPTRMNFYQREPFISFLEKYPKVALKIIEKLSREIKAFQDRLIETSYEGSDERMARLLLMMRRSTGLRKRRGLRWVDLSRSELAELAGISTETAIRTLSAFKERGYVELDGPKIYLRDRESLSKIAEPFEIRLKENLFSAARTSAPGGCQSRRYRRNSDRSRSPWGLGTRRGQLLLAQQREKIPRCVKDLDAIMPLIVT
jgi:CRP-like cAMP-binding protein